MIDASKYGVIPYKNRGTDFDGCDCWGLVRLVYKEEYGLELPSFDYTSAELDNSDLIDTSKPTIKAVEVKEPKEGDLVTMAYGGYEGHVGLVVSGGRVLHTCRAYGTVCEPLRGWGLRSRIRGFYRVAR